MPSNDPAIPFSRDDPVDAYSGAEPMLPGGDAQALLAHLDRARTAARTRQDRVDLAPSYAGLLAHADPAVKTAAATALGGLGRSAEAAVPALVAQLAAPEPAVAEAVIDALKCIGPAAADAGLHHVIARATETTDDAACIRLMRLAARSRRPMPESFLPVAVRMLAGVDREGRRQAINPLEVAVKGWSAEARRSLSAALVGHLENGIRDLRRRSARLLSTLAQDAAPAAESLAATLCGSADEEIVRHAADALAAIGGDATRAAIGHLRDRLRAACNGPISADRLPGPGTWPEHWIRTGLVALLGRLGHGPLAGESAAALVEYLNSGPPTIRGAVAHELQRLMPFLSPGQRGDLLPALRTCLAGPDTAVHDLVVLTLGSFAEQAGEVAPLLSARLGDPSTRVETAIAALRRLGPEAERAGAERLAELMRSHESPSRRIELAAGVQALGPDVIAIGLAALVRLLGDVDDDVRIAACRRLQERAYRLSPAHEAAVAEGLRAWPTDVSPPLRECREALLGRLRIVAESDRRE